MNWETIRNEYETTSITLKALSEKHAIKLGTLKSRKSREEWNRDATQTKKVATNKSPPGAKPKKDTKPIVESEKLTEKQRLFCMHYLKSFNATQSAIKAGYSKDSAHVQGPRLLGNVRVGDYIRQLKEEIQAQLFVSAADVLNAYMNENYRIDASISSAKNCGENGVYADATSTVNAWGIDTDGSHTSVRSQNGGVVNVGYDLDSGTISKLNNALHTAIHTAKGGKVYCDRTEILNAGYQAINSNGGEVYGIDVNLSGTGTSVDVNVEKGGHVTLIDSSPVSVTEATGGVFTDNTSGVQTHERPNLENGWTLGDMGLTFTKINNQVFVTGNMIPGTITKGIVLSYMPSWAMPPERMRLPVTEKRVGQASQAYIADFRENGTVRIDFETDWNSGAYSQYYVNVFYFVD
ncbi:terminase small subunit [Sinobaca qinghaiensis]|uniref:Terminase small subunit n=1 Tax=Sinobaca qinghaiensis TaxID=342944 RepID=A0A419V5N0_9BACL|nr:terminase small subunit [Sinobaca qinghaiensis]RKD75216.1 terminase small subunit [Sinobaca qinghaiensis]